MNKERRKKIEEVIKEIDRIKDSLQLILDDEQFAFDNMPENLQYSQRGEESQEAIDCMEEAIGNMEDIIEQLQII